MEDVTMGEGDEISLVISSDSDYPLAPGPFFKQLAVSGDAQLFGKMCAYFRASC
jgi:hypothetical protein